MKASAVHLLRLYSKTRGIWQTYHEVQVNVVEAKALERRGNTLLDLLVPWVVELCGDPDLLTGNAGVLDTLTDLLLVAVGKGGIDVAVTTLKSGLHSIADLTRLGLPCSETDSRDLCASVELQLLVLWSGDHMRRKCSAIDIP
jgi:hypothetical protein